MRTVMNQREVNRIKFRDTVAEIFRRCLELLAKQHALRVESYAPPIRHALRDEFRADGARHPVLLYPRLSWTHCHRRTKGTKS